MPSSGYPKVSIPHLDKLVHFCLYGVFAALIISESNPLRTSGNVTKRAKLTGLLISSLYGGAIELIQAIPFIARGCSFLDFAADIAGALTASLTYLFFNRILKGFI